MGTIYKKTEKQIIIITCLFFLILTPKIFAQGDWFPLSSPGAASARHGHSMVTLPDGRVLLFGGEDAQGSLFNDIYAFENNGWAQITPKNSPPPARRDHQAWLRADSMFIYGGKGQNGVLDDMWKYDVAANSWQQIQLSGTRPPARQGHTVTTFTDGTEIIIAGTDSSGNALKDVWRLNTNNTFTQLTDAPYAFTEHKAELVVNDDWLLVFGKPGSIGIYRVSTNDWSLVSGGPPKGKGIQTSRGVNPQGDPVIFIFGGEDANGNESNTVYEYDVYNGQLTQRNDMPQPIVNGASTKMTAIPPMSAMIKNAGLSSVQIFDQTLLVFGGITNGVPQNDTYTFSTQTPPDSLIVVATADTVRTDSVSLLWRSAQPIQASFYELQVASDTGMTTLLADTLITDTTFTVVGLNAITDYRWRVRAYNAGGWGDYNTPLHFFTDFVTGIDTDNNAIPSKFELSQNYPNPFNPSTTIKYSIPAVETGYIPSLQLKIYDILGHEVATLVNENQSPGNYKIIFNADGLPSGIYFYSLAINNRTVQTKKMLLLR